MRPFPWDESMRFGLGILRLAPKDFWAMSPRELAAAHRAIYQQAEPLARARFAELMQEFPDEVSQNGRQ